MNEHVDGPRLFFMRSIDTFPSRRTRPLVSTCAHGGTLRSKVRGRPRTKVREKGEGGGGGITPSRTATTTRAWPQRALNPSSSCPGI